MSAHIKENALSLVCDNSNRDSLVKRSNVLEKNTVLETSSNNDSVATIISPDSKGAVSNTHNREGALIVNVQSEDTAVSSTDTPDGYLTITKTSAPDAIISDDNTVFTSEITIILTDYTDGASDASAPATDSLE